MCSNPKLGSSLQTGIEYAIPENNSAENGP